ncbi:DUF5818 domain-containing protein [Sphingosinithalassobacter sp. CS137]|uniref:DUF5818 domain-containing protein n=1 Tax=Sphingosinithalassobacter sp. CS137 TaxID=2762748 RepID=UPI00165E164C|nr:DUF5818 domain-containing protein [Sphingosinithalassobacter sp. CS137]
MTELPDSRSAASGARVRETGTLVRETGGFVLRCDHGGKLALLLRRTPVDQVEKRVVLTGRLLECGTLEVEAIADAAQVRGG